VAATPKPRESAKAAADRKRHEAEARNARHRRTRELRVDLVAAEGEAEAADRELSEVTERLADPGIYADASLVRGLVERHNQLRDLVPDLMGRRDRLTRELAEGEADPSAVGTR
jgi:hypothetical protein